MSRPAVVALAPDDTEVIEFLQSPHDGSTVLGAAIERADPVVLAVGVGDRSEVRIDPAVAALQLGLVTGLPVLIAVSPERDHPYNVARRVLTIDHMLAGRVGVLLGEGTAGTTISGPRAWTDAPRDALLLADFARVLREQWSSWPRESLVGDRAGGVFADTRAIRRPEHSGVYDVAGPSTAWSSVQGEPVLATTVALPAGLAEVTVPQELALVTPSDAASRPAEPRPADATLRELLGLADRRLDTSAWPPAFDTGQRGAA